ncbi:PAS domain S-box protein [Alicyclobacillus fodiniaquatilis]|uniref:histidine kinase n=1 Tax=Alicyclobacillus fodiniaquatilis TaxID=1661150 RepID=A0ABW4JPX5_9BACL
MKQYSLNPSGRHRLFGSVRVVIGYIIVCSIWLAVSAPLIWEFRWHPLLITSLRILYFISSAIILYYMLQRERALLESRHEYEQLVHTLLEPVMIHVDGKILDVNPYAIHFFEANSKDALIGKYILDMIHPDYRNVAQERVKQLSDGTPTNLIEEKFITLNGAIRDVEIVGVPITFHGKTAVLAIFRDITERKQHQMAIRDSEHRLRTLIDAMPDLICFVDDKGRWVEANSTLLRTVGLASDVFRGKTSLELAELCNPQYRDEFINNSGYTEHIFETVTHFSREYHHAGNKFVAHEVTRAPVKTADGSNMGLIVISRDVSEQRLATKQLMESEQRYRSLFDNDGDMVVSVDVNGIILSANPSCETTLGYEPEELVGRYYRELIAPEYYEDAQERFLRVLEGEPQIVLISLLHKEGHRVEAHEKKIPIVIDEKVTGFFCIVRDITEQKAADELLVKSERLSAVGEMAAGIAHEIRNPLTTLKGFVQLMQSSQNMENFYLAVMRDEFERIESILNELLVFARPTARVLERYNCAHLVQEVIDLMTPQATLQNILISHSIEIGSLDIMCEKSRLKQVLVNVIKNAIEAMPNGGQIDIYVRAVDEQQSVSIGVRDNGPGIPAEVAGRIGEPFYTTKGTGTGLGLMVSRKIVEAHQGILRIQSEEGRGTHVEMILPVHGAQ